MSRKPTNQSETFELVLRLQITTKETTRQDFLNEVARKARKEAGKIWEKKLTPSGKEVFQACADVWRVGDSQGRLKGKVHEHMGIPPEKEKNNTILKYVKAWMDRKLSVEHAPHSVRVRWFKRPTVLNAHIKLYLTLVGSVTGLNQLANASPTFKTLLDTTFPNDLPEMNAMRPLEDAVIQCANTPQYKDLISELAKHWPNP